MSRAAGRTRPKKLAPRQNIQIVREDQVDSLTDFDSGRGPIETGVEKAEESVSSSLPFFSLPLPGSLLARLELPTWLLSGGPWHIHSPQKTFTLIPVLLGIPSSTSDQSIATSQTGCNRQRWLHPDTTYHRLRRPI